MPTSAQQPFFDGTEGEPALTSFSCASCGDVVTLDAWSFVAAARSGDRITPEEIRSLGLYRGLVRAGFEMQVTLLSPDGLAAYVGALPCPSCGRSMQIVLGFGEFQPSRYMAVLFSVC